MGATIRTNQTTTTMSTYQEAKKNALLNLRQFAEEVNKDNPTDKTLCRQAINDYADILQRDLPYSLHEDARRAIGDALADLAGELHPKNKEEQEEDFFDYGIF